MSYNLRSTPARQAKQAKIQQQEKQYLDALLKIKAQYDAVDSIVQSARAKAGLAPLPPPPEALAIFAPLTKVCETYS